MIELQEIVAKDVPVLGTYTLSLNKYPLCVIRGRNLDKSKQANSSNGSGKTLSISPIPTLLYESTPTSLKNKGTKDLLQSKNSSIELRFNNGRNRTIKRELTSSVKTSITTDGRVKLYRESKEAKLQIQKLFPISEAQFLSQCFINGRQKTVLQVGTPTQRFEYLETIFRLNEYDHIGNFIVKDHNKMKVLLQESQVLISEQLTRKKDLPIMDKARFNVKQKQIEERIEQLNLRVDKYLDLLNNVKNYINLVDDIDVSRSLDDLQVELEEAQKEHIDLTKLYKVSIKHYETLEQEEQLRVRRQRLKQSIKGIPEDSRILPETFQKRQSLIDQQTHLSTLITEAQNSNKQHNRLQNELKSLELKLIPSKYKDWNVQDFEKALVKWRFMLKEHKESIKNLQDYIDHEHKDATCPICQRGLSKKTAHILVKTLQTKSSQAVRKITAYKAYINLQRLQDELKIYPLIDLSENEAKQAKIERSIVKYENLIQRLEKKVRLEEILENLPKPQAKMDTKIPKPFIYEDTIKDLNKRIVSIENTIKIKRRVDKLELEFDSLVQAKEKYVFYKDKLSKYRPILQDLQKNLQDVISKTSVYESINSDIQRISTKIEDLNVETKDFKVLEAMRKAFGTKGLRKIKTRYYVQQLQDAFNKYAYLIYAEKIKFHFQLTDTKFDILYEMNGRINDVRRMSGAESSCFTLLLILCILPFIPSNHRCNLLILDEIEIGFDLTAKEKFINDFLPILQQVIPNIFIVTPQSEHEFYIPNAVTYLVTKKNGKSTIAKFK